MSPRRASLPPPLPPLRARPNSPLRFRSGRDRPVSSLPPPTPRGGKITIARPLVPPAAPSPPLPPLAPARSRPFAFARVVPGQTARCPLPLPAGALITSIHTFHHNYCVSAPPSLGRFFFSFARSFTWVHASLCFGLGPGERPRKGFPACAHHKSNS